MTIEKDKLLQGHKKILKFIIRSGALRHWEPIFIGTNKDPAYDERLTWEGRADKMVIFIMTMIFKMMLSVMVLMMMKMMYDEKNTSMYLRIFQVQGVKLCLMRYFSLLYDTFSKTKPLT